MIAVRSSRILAVVSALVGFLLLAVGVLSGDLLRIVPGGLLGVVGVLLLINPIAVIRDDQVQIRSPLGFTVRRIPIDGPADLDVQNGRVIHVPTGKRVMSLGFGTDAGDADRVRAWIGTDPA